ncbi:hypothetical protein Cni_G20054 [Canna indica]|uniref:Uncharacterized protein n=1 Tax=Canna indica TaxID=4628 RepID=A0AAQ3KLQ8_9LILI|nr:hypothetical protein Cni_G20054 [Canna indica]
MILGVDFWASYLMNYASIMGMVGRLLTINRRGLNMPLKIEFMPLSTEIMLGMYTQIGKKEA